MTHKFLEVAFQFPHFLHCYTPIQTFFLKEKHKALVFLNCRETVFFISNVIFKEVRPPKGQYLAQIQSSYLFFANMNFTWEDKLFENDFFFPRELSLKKITLKIVHFSLFNNFKSIKLT